MYFRVPPRSAIRCHVFYLCIEGGLALTGHAAEGFRPVMQGKVRGILAGR